jgi:hypothetical protein
MSASLHICADPSLLAMRHMRRPGDIEMTVRTSRKTVTFTQPFSLSGIEVQPAGTYTVETDEELLPGLSFPAYRRVASLIFLRSRGGGPVVEEIASVDPLELQAAQERDAGLHTLADYHSGYLDQNDGQRI